MEFLTYGAAYDYCEEHGIDVFDNIEPVGVVFRVIDPERRYPDVKSDDSATDDADSSGDSG